MHELEDLTRDNKSLFEVIRNESEDVATGTETVLYLCIAAHVSSVIAAASMSTFVASFGWLQWVAAVLVGVFILLGSIVWFPNATAEHGGTVFLYYTWPFWALSVPCHSSLDLGFKYGRTNRCQDPQCHGRRKRRRRP